MSSPIIQTPQNPIVKTSIAAALGAACGAFAGRYTQVISPAGGAIFGAASHATTALLDSAIIKMNIKSTVAKTALKVASVFISFMAAIGATKAAGFMMSMAEAKHLFIVTNLTALAATIAIVAGVCLGAAAVVGVAVLAKNERYA